MGGSPLSAGQSGSSTEPPCTVSVTGAGGAIVLGQSAPATETRSGLAGRPLVGAGVEQQVDVELLARHER